jgi:hypothetical protein
MGIRVSTKSNLVSELGGLGLLERGFLVSTGCLLHSVQYQGVGGDSAGAQLGTVKLIGPRPRKLT